MLATLDFAGVPGLFATLRKIGIPLVYQWFAPPLARRFQACGFTDSSTGLMASEQPIVAGVAGRYATALFDLALEEKALDNVRADLDRFDEMVAASADLDRLVRSPVFTAEEQVKALDPVLKLAEIDGISANFLKLVASNRRLFTIRNIIKAYRALVATHKGEVSASVTVAEPLSDQHLADLKSALNTVTGKDVDLQVEVDPAIIGGLVVKLGSRMVDSSLRTKLNSIKTAMKEAR
jgi:F-type H+-transporting ATPase subunit delta